MMGTGELVWCLMLCRVVSMVWAEEMAVGVVAGAHFHPLTKVTVYSSSVPMHFQVAWPRSLPGNVDIINRGLTCSDEGLREFCKIQKESKSYLLLAGTLLQSVDQAAGEDLKESEEVHRAKRGITFLGEALNWCCDVATSSQIEVLFKNEQELMQHYEQMSNQILTNHAELANFSNQVKIVNEAVAKVFSKIQGKFDNFSKVLTDLKETVDESYYGISGEISHLQQSQLFLATLVAKQTHSFYQIEILDQCRSHKLPAVLIPPAKLKTELENLDRVVGKDGYQLAISSQDTQIYYHLPISKCQIFNEQLFVKIKVPIIRKQAEWKLFDFIAVPFSWKNSICVLHHETTFLAVSNDQVTAIRGRALQDCRPFQDHLCFVPRYSGDAMTGAMCPRAVFNGATAEHLAEVCSFSCQSGTQLIITQVGPERYFLTNAVGKLEVSCSMSKNETRMLGNVIHPGALDVAVPCDCQLRINNELRINEMYPCDYAAKTKFDLIHVIPAAWSKVKQLHFSPQSTSRHMVFSSLHDCLAENWTLSIPHINVSIDTTQNLASKIHLEEPVGYQNFWIRNLQSISLGVIIVVLTVIVIRNPYLIGIGSLPRASAEDIDTIVALEIGSTTIIIVLTIVFVCCVLLRFYRNTRRRAERTTSPAQPEQAGGEPSCSIVGQLEERLRSTERIPATIRDPDGKKIRLWLTINEG